MITKIYLVTNCYGDPNKVYIGKTKNCRKNPHIKTFGSQIIYDYIDEVNSFNKDDWKPLECFWIEQFRQWGFNVINKNRGGNGSDFLSDETKQKISKSKLGQKYSIEHGIKISKALKGKSKPKGFGIGKIISKDTKEKNNKIVEYVKQNKVDIIAQVKKYPYDVVDIDDEQKLTLELVKMCKDVLRDKMTTTLLKTILEVIGSEEAKTIIVMFPDVFKKMIESKPTKLYDIVVPEDVGAIKKIFPDIKWPENKEYE